MPWYLSFHISTNNSSQYLTSKVWHFWHSALCAAELWPSHSASPSDLACYWLVWTNHPRMSRKHFSLEANSSSAPIFWLGFDVINKLTIASLFPLGLLIQCTSLKGQSLAKASGQGDLREHSNLSAEVVCPSRNLFMSLKTLNGKIFTSGVCVYSPALNKMFPWNHKMSW